MATKKKKQKEEVAYMVSFVVFASMEMREKYFQKGSGELQLDTIFYGYTEQWAAVRFYRACQQVHRNPLIQGVQVMRNGKTVVWVSSGVPPAWSMPEFAF